MKILPLIILLSLCISAAAQPAFPIAVPSARLTLLITNRVPVPARTNIMLTITPTNYFSGVTISTSTNLLNWSLAASASNDVVRLPIAGDKEFFRANITSVALTLTWTPAANGDGVIILARNTKNGRPFAAMWDIPAGTNQVTVYLSDPDRVTLFDAETYDSAGDLSAPGNTVKFKLPPLILSISAQ